MISTRPLGKILDEVQFLFTFCVFPRSNGPLADVKKVKPIRVAHLDLGLPESKKRDPKETKEKEDEIKHLESKCTH